MVNFRYNADAESNDNKFNGVTVSITRRQAADDIEVNHVEAF